MSEFLKSYLLNWIGGKRLLRKTIEPLIPEDIESYIEPFGGGGWLLFYKYKWADLEIYNDLDDRLVNLFKIVKYHPDELIKEFRFMITSRKLFYETLESPAYTDIQRAAKFMYIIARSFGGKGTHFGTSKRNTGMKSQFNILDRINVIHKRLDKVLIENMSFEKLIANYDHDKAFFYCDPPYVKGEDYYKTTAKEKFNHELLASTLKGIKGRFLLSYDDNSKIRELYKDFNIIAVERQNGINNTSSIKKNFKELIIMNYTPKTQ